MPPRRTWSSIPACIAASITAAREGGKVVLIEPAKHVGGLSTRGINTAKSEHMLKWIIGGFADEFCRRMDRYYEETKARQRYPHKDRRLDSINVFESSVAEKVYLDMLKESDAGICYGASVDKAFERLKISGAEFGPVCLDEA